MHFGQKIKNLREYFGYSQEQLAQKINDSQRNVSNWEKMQYPPLDAIIRICQALGVDLSAFFNGFTPEDMRFLSVYKELSEQERQAVLRVMELLGFGK